MALLERVRNVLGLRSSAPRGMARYCAFAFCALVLLIVAKVAMNPRAPEAPPAQPVASLPSEHNKMSLPEYTIEPPDILQIEAMRVVPKPPYHLQSQDAVRIEADGIPEPILGVFAVDPEGRVNLGPQMGKANIVGLTLDQAEQAVRAKIAEIYDAENHNLSVSLYQSSVLRPINHQHLVASDGNINLGHYGQVYVAGKTIVEATAAIEEQLAKSLDRPKVAVSVFAYNSKTYYVISKGAGTGDTVARFPITGSETVLDAVAQASGIKNLSTKAIWIARPTPGGTGCDAVLPVNWQEITAGAATTTNYQVLPGDRIFIQDKPTALGWLHGLWRS